MSPEEKRLILRCAELETEFHNSPEPEPWAWWFRSEWQEIQEHGPRYLAGTWFGPTLREHARQRYRRAVDVLEDAGLLVTWRSNGKRLSNLKLTPAGATLARQLLSQQEKNHDGTCDT